jgi:hypothetical protein
MDDQQGKGQENERREYFPPKIVHSEKLTARAAECMKSDTSCAPGPIQS